MIRKVFLLSLVVGLGACQSSTDEVSPAEFGQLPDASTIARNAQRYLVEGGQIAEGVTVRVANLKEFSTPGLFIAEMTLTKEGQSQRVPLYVAGAGRWVFLTDPIDLQLDPITVAREAITISAEDAVMGSPEAPVTIVEYADFQCPFCADADTIVQQELIPRHGRQVRFVYKHLPLASGPTWAVPAAEIGICLLQSSGRDSYWRYHPEVFARQQDFSATDADVVVELLRIAVDAGGDAGELDRCRTSGAAAKVLAETALEAATLGLQATPTFFVNGRKLSGAQPVEAFTTLIERAELY